MSKSEAKNGDLSMIFHSINDNDEVIIKASPDAKRELIEFIDSTLSTEQIDLAEHAFVNALEVKTVRDSIAAQIGGDDLVLGRYDFVQLSKIATAWNGHGFNLHDEGSELDVSKSLVDNIERIFDAAFPE